LTLFTPSLIEIGNRRTISVARQYFTELSPEQQFGTRFRNIAVASIGNLRISAGDVLTWSCARHFTAVDQFIGMLCTPALLH
jgi:hypothetical protein